MFQLTNLRKKLSILAIIFINAIVITKYSAKVIHINAAFLVGAGVSVVVFLIADCLAKKIKKSNVVFWCTIACATIFSVILLRLLPVESITNDRYYMIEIFWQNLFSGINPYTPHSDSLSTNIPAGFPFYFFLTLPFHLINEIGFAGLASFVLSAIAVFRSFSLKEGYQKNITILTLFTSASLWYEIAGRSTILFNTALVIVFIMELDRINFTKRSCVIAGILAGLLLSSRSIFLLPIATYFVQRWVHSKFERHLIIKTTWVAALTCIGTLFPLIFWWNDHLREYNPITTQYSLLPTWLVLLVVVFTIGVATKFKTNYYFLISSGLFLIVMMYDLKQIMLYGFADSLFNHKIDISYLFMPFLFFVLSTESIPAPVWQGREKEPKQL